jgi:hypothetical protein
VRFHGYLLKGVCGNGVRYLFEAKSPLFNLVFIVLAFLLFSLFHSPRFLLIAGHSGQLSEKTPWGQFLRSSVILDFLLNYWCFLWSRPIKDGEERFDNRWPVNSLKVSVLSSIADP